MRGVGGLCSSPTLAPVGLSPIITKVAGMDTHNGAAVVYRSYVRVAPSEISAFLVEAVKVLDAFRH
jgi:hypothetical protein